MSGEGDKAAAVRFGEFEQVAETAQFYEAELMALRLQAEGIQAEVVDQTFRQEPLPSVRAFAVVRVLVPLEHAARARELLSGHAELPTDGEAGGSEPDDGEPGATG